MDDRWAVRKYTLGKTSCPVPLNWNISTFNNKRVRFHWIKTFQQESKHYIMKCDLRSFILGHLKLQLVDMYCDFKDSYSQFPSIVKSFGSVRKTSSTILACER